MPFPILAVSISPKAAVLAGIPSGDHQIQLTSEALAPLTPEQRALVADYAVSAGNAQTRHAVSLPIPTLEAWLERAKDVEAQKQIQLNTWRQALTAAEAGGKEYLSECPEGAPGLNGYTERADVSAEDAARYQAVVARREAARQAGVLEVWRAGAQAALEAGDSAPSLYHVPTVLLTPADHALIEQIRLKREAAAGARLAAEEAQKVALLEAYCAARPADAARARAGHVGREEMLEVLIQVLLQTPLALTAREPLDEEATHDACGCEEGCGGEVSHRIEETGLSPAEFAALQVLQTRVAERGRAQLRPAAEVIGRVRVHQCDCDGSQVAREGCALIRLPLEGAGVVLQLEVGL